MKSERSKSYYQISTVNLREAMYNLKGNAFKLYCYLGNNADGYNLDLYPCDFCNVANVSNSTYQDAFKELVEKGYLIKDADSKTMFWFMEKSEEAEQVPTTYDLIETVDKDATAEALQRAIAKRKQDREKT